MEEKKQDALPEDVTRYSVTQEDLIQLGMIVQLAIRSGEWDVAGIKPNEKCSKCYGRGYINRNVLLDQYTPCQCVVKQLRKALLHMKEIQAIQAEETKKKAEQNTGLVDVNGNQILKEEEAKNE